MNILTHKVIGLDEHGEDPKCLGVYDTLSAQRVADSWNLIWDSVIAYALPTLSKNNFSDYEPQNHCLFENSVTFQPA